MTETPSSDRMSFTIFMAIALHAMVIFGISFTLPKSDKAAPTLNITLATHKSKERPKNADFLAQSDQEASGTETEVNELSTTELAEISDVRVNQVNPLQSAATSTQEQQVPQHTIITTSSRSTQTVLKKPKIDTVESKPEHSDKPSDAQVRSEKLASLQAKLDRERQALAREPRITRHTSVSAKSSDEAAYYNYWSDKVVRIGNQNFPKEALKQEIFGSLRLEVSINADGRVRSTKVTHSSGHALLDEAAKRIVRLAAPFKPLPDEITQHADVFVIYRTWNFEITGLTTSE